MGMLEEYRNARSAENARPQVQELLTQGIGAVIQHVSQLRQGLSQIQSEIRSQAQSGANSQQILAGVAQMLANLQLPDNSAGLAMLSAQIDEKLTKETEWVFDIQRDKEGLITSVTATAGDDE